MTDAARKPKLTVPDLATKKAAGARLSMVAIADFMTATWAWRAGIDIVGVGDSMGMTMYGHENTLECTVDQLPLGRATVPRRPVRHRPLRAVEQHDRVRGRLGRLGVVRLGSHHLRLRLLLRIGLVHFDPVDEHVLHLLAIHFVNVGNLDTAV